MLLFGFIEKDVKKKETILCPEELLTIIRDHGTVIDVAESVRVLDFKSSMKEVMRQVGSCPFPISKVKRIITRRGAKIPSLIEIRGEPYYNFDVTNFANVFVKKTFSASNSPAEICETNTVKKEKKKDIETFWRRLEK